MKGPFKSHFNFSVLKNEIVGNTGPFAPFDNVVPLIEPSLVFFTYEFHITQKYVKHINSKLGQGHFGTTPLIA